MDMKAINAMIKKHDELLDSMTKEEKVAYYASYGITINNKNRESALNTSKRYRVRSKFNNKRRDR